MELAESLVLTGADDSCLGELWLGRACGFEGSVRRRNLRRDHCFTEALFRFPVGREGKLGREGRFQVV